MTQKTIIQATMYCALFFSCLVLLTNYCTEAQAGGGNCTWVTVGGMKSHQPGTSWCPAGSFLSQLDLDSDNRMDPHDSPIVGQAKCCRIADNIPAGWKDCGWVPVGAQSSHQRGPAWCPEGSFLTQLDLDGDKRYSGYDTPYVGQAMCCKPSGNKVSGWSSSTWVNVGGTKSHQPNQAWCPDGSYLTRLDLDGDKRYSEHDAPVIGAALCSTPRTAAVMPQAVPMVTMPTVGVMGTIQAVTPPPQPNLPAVDLKIISLAICPPPEAVNGAKIILHTFRSYRVEATIDRAGAGQLPDFIVRTECVRNGSHFMLGEARVGAAPGSGSKLYAGYDIFPSSGGLGDCLLRTIVDADNTVMESDESAAGNVWERQALIAR